MQLLPTIIILALLVFFVALTALLFIWYWRRHRAMQRKRFFSTSNQSMTKAPRKLTLRDGKAIPHHLVLENASEKDRYSLDLQSPGLELEKQFEFDIERGFTRTTISRNSSKRISRTSGRTTITEKGQGWTPGRPPWLRKTPPESVKQSDTASNAKTSTRSKRRDRSVSVPRPALINIERRDSGQTQRSSEPSYRSRTRKPIIGQRTSSKAQVTHRKNEKRKGIDITESLFNAYKGSTPWTGEVHNLPPSSVVMPGPAKTVASSTRNSRQRWSIPATASVVSSIPTTTTGLDDSSRVTSGVSSIHPLAPLFDSTELPKRESLDAGGRRSSDGKVTTPSRVSFAPTQEANRKSFLTITESPTSSTSSEAAVLGRGSMVRTKLDPPLTAPPVPTLPAWASEYNEQSRPIKTLSAPAPNPPEVLEKVRAFGRRHRDRPRSGFRHKKVAQLAISEEKPVGLAERRQVSSELLRQLERPRSTVRHERGTSDLLNQLEETANQVQRQSKATNLFPHMEIPPLPTSGPTSSPGPTGNPAPTISSGPLISPGPLTSPGPTSNPGPTSHPGSAPTSAPREPLISPSILTEDPKPRSGTVRQRRMPHLAGFRPPSIEIDIPHVERGSLSFLDTIPTPPRSGHDLRRGPSVMSNRSGFTIASSEISANWSIREAELVNIYPSVADDEDEYESIRQSMRESLGRSVSPRQKTPPYAKVLRSKYGQYPKTPRGGTKDKALPLLPKSPLRQSEFAS